MWILARKVRSAFILLKERAIWRERCVSWGDENRDQSFFILRRPAPENGIGSDTIIFLGQLKYMEKTYPNAIPIIDMKNCPQGISEEEGNAWDRFFEQPNTEGWTLEKIEKSANIILADGRFEKHGELPDVIHPHDEWQFLESGGWADIYKQYIRIKPELVAHFEEDWNRLFPKKEEKILGVKARGTDYSALCPSNHPIQPTAEQLAEKIDEFLATGKYTSVFLATEDETIKEKLAAHFGDLLRTLPKKYVEYCGSTINNNYGSGTIPKEVATREYLEEMYLLSKCNAFIAGQNSGVITIFLQNGGRFEETYIFDLGRYK